MNAIEFDSVTKRFPDGSVAVEELTFGVESGETVVLVGPSGCGKTTTLRLLAGLDVPTSGSIKLNQKDVAQLAPVDRNVAMMFQSDALYPHLSVRNNLAFGQKVRRRVFKRLFGSQSKGFRKSVAEIDDRVRDVAVRLGVERLLDRKPHELSGGERQRVALGRAIVRDPAAFLLDEPLSKLDARLADELRVELRRVFQDLGKPVIYVTHDQKEAMALADRLIVMDEGRVVQVGRPLEIYRRPANLFVANFVGSVPVNTLSSNRVTNVPSESESIGFRAENLNLGFEPVDGAGICFRAVVRDAVWLGDHQLIYVAVDELKVEWVARCEANVNFQHGAGVYASVERKELMWFDALGDRIDID